MAQFQVLPTSNRPTIYDAVNQLLSSIQGNQYNAAAQSQQQTQQAREDEQTQYDRSQQQQQDAYDRSQQAQQDYYDRLKDQVDQINSIDDPGQRAAAYQSASPDVQKAFGYDPTKLPAPAPSEPSAAQQNANARLALEKNRFTWEQQQAVQKQQQAAAEKAKPKYQVHPQVADLDKQLQTLSAQEQQLIEGRGPGGQPMEPTMRAQSLYQVRNLLHQKIAARDQTVANLRKAGIDPYPGLHAPTAAAPAATPPPAPPQPVPPAPRAAQNQQPKPRYAVGQTVTLKNGRTITIKALSPDGSQITDYQ